MRFETSTSQQIDSMMASHPVILSAVREADLAFKMAEDLDKLADAHEASGDSRMATVCRARAVMACERGTRLKSKLQIGVRK